MVNVDVQKSYAFITAYLLGVERRILEKDFVEDYAYSEALEKFKKITNAELLRSLSRVKQSIIRNYSIYRNVEDFSSASKGFLDDDKLVLNSNNIDLDKEFRVNLDITDVLNLVSKRINILLLDVLKEFNMPHSKQVASLFYLYDVDKKTLAKLINGIKDNWTKFPKNVIVLKGSRLSQQLPLILETDENMFIGGYNILGEKYVKADYIAYAWSSIVFAAALPRLPIAKSSLIYVDCDNTDYFKFLCILEALNVSSNKGAVHHIKLFIDTQTSPLWRLSPKLLKGCFTFELIEVSRIKNTKSVVDIVIAAHITRDSAVVGHKPQGIVSSDSDFFGLLEYGIKLFVLYDGKSTRQDYLLYLKRKQVVNFDINNLDSNDTRFTFKQSIINHLCLTHLASLPMEKWTTTDLAEFVLSGFDKSIGYGMTLQLLEAKDVAGRILRNLKMEKNGAVVSLSSLGSEVEVTLGVA
jgi:hypothetical protein